MDPKLQALQDHNVLNAVAGGPRVSTSQILFVLARDRANRRVLVGGLGPFGVGRMWFDERETHAGYPGYAEAEEQESGGQFGA